MQSNPASEPTEFPLHPCASLFPAMTEEEFQGLKADIAEHGQRDSITVWNGQLIDGRHRLKACNELSIQPRVCELQEDTDPVAWAISLNLHRRHLTIGQRATIAAKLASQKHGGDRKSANIKSQIQLSISDAAKLLGISPASIKQAKNLIENATQDLIDAVDNGSLSLNAATKLMNGKSVSGSEKPTAEERSKVAKLMQLVRDELQRCSGTELTEATWGVRQVLNEMGPKQKTYEDVVEEVERELAPSRLAAEKARQQREQAQAERLVALEEKYLADMRRIDESENWAAWDAAWREINGET